MFMRAWLFHLAEKIESYMPSRSEHIQFRLFAICIWQCFGTRQRHGCLARQMTHIFCNQTSHLREQHGAYALQRQQHNVADDIV